MRVLKLKPNYEDLINVAVSDKLNNNNESHNRDAQFLRNGFVPSQLDGEGMRAMERQQEQASKESYKEHFEEIANNTSANTHDFRNDAHQELRPERINQALNPTTQFYDISRSDHEMESTHSLPPSIETEIRDNMSDRSPTI